MAITIFGRGYPLSAVSDGTTLNIAWDGTAICDITTTGISGGGITNTPIVSATTVKATTVSATTLSGTSVSVTTVSATNVSATTVSATTISAGTLCAAGFGFTTIQQGASACLCGGTGTISADRFLAILIGGKTYHVPAYASAAAASA